MARSPGQIMTQEPECRTCAIAQQLAADDQQDRSAYVSVDVDEDVVVISGPQLAGLVVVPRRHISGLDELPDPDRAHVLAALRRATRSVLERNPGSATTVVVTTDAPASEGHACFHVAPAAPGYPPGVTSSPGVARPRTSPAWGPSRIRPG